MTEDLHYRPFRIGDPRRIDHSFAKSAAKSNSATPRRPNGSFARPVIRIEIDNLESVVDQAEAALIASDRGLYQRGNRIVCVGEVKVLSANEHEVASQRIFDRGDHALLEDLVVAASFEKWDGRKQDYKTVEPPMKIVHILKERVGRLRFRVLTGVINTPTLRSDGSILEAAGYDARTGLLFDAKGVLFDRVPDRPSRADGERALAKLGGLIDTFPFEGDGDRSVALSAMLTAVVRRALPTAPMHVFSAPVAGSGKSMLVDLVSILATGREAGVIAQGKTEEESEKRLGALLLAGDAVIAIDNCEQPLGGDLLCQLLTQPTVRIRVLGRSETIEVPTGALVTATGNNLVVLGDMTRRTLLCTLDPKVERPENRTFAVNPIAVAKADRGVYVTAALTVLRSYIAAGRPRQVDPLGSFAEWSNLVRSALIWLGGADPVETMEETRKTDPKIVALQMVMAQWRKAIGFDRTSVGDAIRTATEKSKPSHFEGEGTLVRPSFREALLMVAGERGVINNMRLGRWLGKNADRIATVTDDGSEPAKCCFYRAGILDGNTMWSLQEQNDLEAA